MKEGQGEDMRTPPSPAPPPEPLACGKTHHNRKHGKDGRPLKVPRSVVTRVRCGFPHGAEPEGR